MKTKAARKRAYCQIDRAKATAENGQRILEAALQLMQDGWFDQITLDQIAERAGVTVQTVLRRFGSREGIFTAAGGLLGSRMLRHSTEPSVGDVEVAMDQLMDDYERTGDFTVRALAQEPRQPVVRTLLEEGRRQYHAWVAAVFAPYLGNLPSSERETLRCALIAAMDVYVWKLLRRDMRLDKTATREVIRSLIIALLGQRKISTKNARKANQSE